MAQWPDVIKREVRYYPGAIPVAVITIPHKAGNKLVIFATVPQLRYGKATRLRLSQKTCRMNYLINELSGERPEMQTAAAGVVFISIYIPSEYSLFTF